MSNLKTQSTLSTTDKSNGSGEKEQKQEQEQELEESSGPWHKLPPEIVDKILIILGDIDMCGYLLSTSKSTFIPSETVFRYLCSITYPRQTARKQLVVNNWRTWKNMMIYRPRLRTNGIYTLRTSYSKSYCNDNFWEEKQYKSIEVKTTVLLQYCRVFELL